MPDILARFKMAAMKMGLAGVFVILSVFSTVYGGGKTLVLVDNWAIRETHSMFFRSLRGMYFLQKNTLLILSIATLTAANISVDRFLR